MNTLEIIYEIYNALIPRVSGIPAIGVYYNIFIRTCSHKMSHKKIS